jgi:hypothetical protein
LFEDTDGNPTVSVAADKKAYGKIIFKVPGGLV